MNASLIVTAIALGFFGSPHCLGMCGGIVTAFGLSMKTLSPTKRAWLITTYHVGRILSYMLLGLLASWFGSRVLAPFLPDNHLPRILVGGMLVLASLMMLGVPFLNRIEKMGMGVWRYLAPIRQKVLPINSVPKALAAGVLWGFLPCGLVYGALGLALSISATGQQITAVMIMAAFGLGTLPMLIATDGIVALIQKINGKFQLRKFGATLMLLSGVFVAVSPMAMHHLHGHSEHGDHAFGGDDHHNHHNHHNHHH